MGLDKNSTVAELRSELRGRRMRALDLQLNTTDIDQWRALNTVRWDLKDLDTGIYLNQFIKNNDKIAKLIGQIQKSTKGAKAIADALKSAKQTLKKARTKLKDASAMVEELDAFYKETQTLLRLIG